MLADHGWEHQEISGVEGTQNGIFLACRLPFKISADGALPWHINSKGLLTIHIPSERMWVTAAHVPDERSSLASTTSRTKKGKPNYYASSRSQVFRELYTRAKRLQNDRHVIMGDLNAGRKRLDHQRGKATGSDELGKLAQLGYADAFRARRGRAREFSWYSRKGTGYRLDHTLVSKPLRPEVEAVHYDHLARRERLSDHAAMLVSLAEREKTLQNKVFLHTEGQKTL